MRRPLHLVLITLYLATVFFLGYIFQKTAKLHHLKDSALDTGTAKTIAPQPIERQAPHPKPVILLWVPPYAEIKWTLPETAICGGGCVITKDRSLHNQSDAVVFFMKATDTASLPDPATHSRDRKVYVWWCEENPWTVRNCYHKSLTEFNGYFNWTMHYKSDSDVLATLIPHTARDWLLRRMGRGDEVFHKTVAPGFKDEEFETAFSLLREEKKNTAVIVVSDCDFTKGARERMAFAKQMESMNSLEIFGLCNGKKLPKSNSEFHKVLRKYKFYMAFENVKGCNDYVTEKFWINSLYVGCVPVVWGPKKADVARLAPPNSFIHAADFDYDAKRLVEYLKEVDRNETKYKSFFEWWKEPGFYPVLNFREPTDKRDVVSDDALGYQVSAHCHLCRKLYDKEHLGKSNVIENLAEHFYGKEVPACYA